MADIQDAELEAAEAQLAALNTQLSTLETGTPGASGTDGDVLASMRQLRSTLVADTEIIGGVMKFSELGCSLIHWPRETNCDVRHSLSFALRVGK